MRRRNVVGWKWRLIRGEGFATWINNHVRPQAPGGGAQTLLAPRRMMDIDVTDASDLSGGGGGGPQSVPSRNSVRMVEEAIAGGTPCWGVHVMNRVDDSRLE